MVGKGLLEDPFPFCGEHRIKLLLKSVDVFSASSARPLSAPFYWDQKFFPHLLGMRNHSFFTKRNVKSRTESESTGRDEFSRHGRNGPE